MYFLCGLSYNKVERQTTNGRFGVSDWRSKNQKYSMPSTLGTISTAHVLNSQIAYDVAHQTRRTRIFKKYSKETRRRLSVVEKGPNHGARQSPYPRLTDHIDIRGAHIPNVPLFTSVRHLLSLLQSPTLLLQSTCDHPKCRSRISSPISPSEIPMRTIVHRFHVLNLAQLDHTRVLQPPVSAFQGTFQANSMPVTATP